MIIPDFELHRTINDADGPRVAGPFYEHLFKNCNDTDLVVPPDLTKSAEALHLSIARLREEPNISFARWVPFAHYGL
ncbi:hypothetical protein B0H10DRAFT_1797711 [Mycena sp. CBHHK59/15]|nr:hypothetical protein B0H10DRAFT_1797711 [Mycena sp. CBHHK59/15]